MYIRQMKEVMNRWHSSMDTLRYGLRSVQESRREGWTDARSAVGFCLGSGWFGSYNSD